MAVRVDNNADLLKFTTQSAASSANLSVCCWVKRKVDTGTFATTIYLRNTTDSHELWLETETGGDVAHMFDLQTTEADLTGPTLTIDTWFFLAFSRTNTSRTLYWGTESGGTLSTATDGSTHTGSHAVVDFWIGQDIYTEGFNGEISLVRYWDTNLSSGEMDSEWRSLTPVKTANLRADYRLAAAASATTDSGPNTLTLTSGGTLTDGGADPVPPAASFPPGLGPDLHMRPTDGGGALLRY